MRPSSRIGASTLSFPPLNPLIPDGILCVCPHAPGKCCQTFPMRQDFLETWAHFLAIDRSEGPGVSHTPGLLCASLLRPRPQQKLPLHHPAVEGLPLRIHRNGKNTCGISTISVSESTHCAME